MTIATYADYKKQIRSLIVEYGRRGILSGASPIVFLEAKGLSLERGGLIKATDPPLKFKDGATLRVLEVVQVAEATIERLRYTYHYERANGYFFCYEREETDDLIRKPEYHMHAVLNLPHFNAPPVHLEIMLQLIAANFYSQDLYTKQIIGQEIRLTV